MFMIILNRYYLNFETMNEKIFEGLTIPSTIYYKKLAENCKLDFNNSDVGYCLEYHPDEVLSSSKHISENIAKLHLYQTQELFQKLKASSGRDIK